MSASTLHLSRGHGQAYWRSLEERAGTAEFSRLLEQELPGLAGLWESSLDRRSLLKLLGASLALAGLGGCGDSAPREALLPYVEAPDGLVPGRALHFATALTLGGYARGVMVASREGRPIKVEGNPRHPSSLGATDLFAQAEILSLYDPDRSQALTYRGRASSWPALLRAIGQQEPYQGEGLYLLTGRVRSPCLGDQIERLLQRFPQARWHVHEPVDDDALLQGAGLAFGQALQCHYRMDRAAVILSLDADFLLSLPGHLRYARDFADGRRVRDGASDMNRLYVAESTPSVTGAMADHLQPLRASQIETLARHLARRLGADIVIGEQALPVPAVWLDTLVGDLRRHAGRSLVLAGPHQPPGVHALVYLINAHLGNLGQTLILTQPPRAGPWQQAGSLARLADDMAAGRVRTLLMLDTNPVYTAAPELAFAEGLKRVPLSIHHGLYQDETAALATWHIPALHELEAWGDACAHEGTLALQQPLIGRLYGGRSGLELLAALRGERPQTDQEILRHYWRERRGGEGFEAFWRQALYDGVIADTALPPQAVQLRADLPVRLPAPAAGIPGLELQLRPDPTLWDGRYANNAWLQELPKPLTQLCWDNAAFLSPATAARLGLENRGRVILRHAGNHIEVPVWVQPNHPDDAVTLHLGHGRWRAGQVGQGSGVDAYRLRSQETPWFGPGLEMVPLGEQGELVTTQQHHTMHGRDLFRHASLGEFRRDPTLFRQAAAETSLYPPHESAATHAWGMVVDTHACIGCKACTIACQAENNIPPVGKAAVAAGREMHWLRVDVWHQGSPARPRTFFQPVPCMHCEKAPCEYVCPVEATLHTPEGLNAQVYNRCVGTRFCSQNCPYKVRRFNFLAWTRQPLAVPAPVNNPEVTVRSLGVMEKCTYCVQRISRARIEAKKEGRRIRDGEVQTACQQACPTRAIIFGDLNDPQAAVRRYKDHPLDYILLAELNTRPRTSFLARLRNPHPGLTGD